MGKKAGPKPPDYTAMAEQTAQQQQQQATQANWANRPNQTNPWGNVSWQASQSIDPTTGKPVTSWNQNTTLDPQLQQALDAQQQLQAGRSDLAQGMWGNVAGSLGTPMNWGQFGDVTRTGGPNVTGTTTGAAFDPTARSGQAANAAYAQATSRLDPQWQKRQTDLETQLANAGISRNSEAYTRAMSDLGTGRSDAYNQAQWTAQQAGATEAQRMQQMQLGQEQQAFGQGLQANAQNWNQQSQYANYENQLRSQLMNEAIMQRGFGLNEINALLGGQGVQGPTFGGFNQAQMGQTPDYSQAAQQQYNAAYQQQANKNAANSQMMSALGGIVGSFIMPGAGTAAGAALGSQLSDRRLKKILRRIGQHPRGFGIYAFRFIGETIGERIGVIAQEVQRVLPEAVIQQPNGLLMVDYAKL